MSVSTYACTSVRNESATFKGMRESFRWLTSQQFKPFLSKLTGCCVFDCTALGPTVILRALTCLDKGPETGGFSRVLGVVGIISIFYVLG